MDVVAKRLDQGCFADRASAVVCPVEEASRRLIVGGSGECISGSINGVLLDKEVFQKGFGR